MFSFRTTPIDDQLDRALLRGKVGCFCTQSSWNPGSGLYTENLFRQRGNLAKVFSPNDGHFDFSQSDLENLDAIVVDFQDSGCRHFRYTRDLMRLLVFRARMEEGPSIYIMDRPNPTGRTVEGSMPIAPEPELWTPPVPLRHGLTLGELCYCHQKETGATYPLHIISAELAPKELMSWAIPPSDDLPGLFSCALSCGGALWKDTNMSCGIGTTRPYEYIGSPFISKEGYPPCPEGVLMRPCTFTPAFGAYSSEECRGYQILLRPGARYHSLMHTLELMRFFSEHYSEFSMNEALFTRLADPVMAEYLKGGITFDIVQEHVKTEEQKWTRKAKRFCLYDDLPCRIK